MFFFSGEAFNNNASRRKVNIIEEGRKEMDDFIFCFKFICDRYDDKFLPLSSSLGRNKVMTLDCIRKELKKKGCKKILESRCRVT